MGQAADPSIDGSHIGNMGGITSLVEQFMKMGTADTGPLAGLPIGQVLSIPPRVQSFFSNKDATDAVRKEGFSAALEGDYASEVKGFLTDAGKLVDAAMRKAGFAPEAPSPEVYGDAPGIPRTQRAALDQEAGRQFVAEAAALISKTPGWYSLDKKTQAKMLADAHKAAVEKATYPGLMQSYGPSRKRRVALGPVP
jgi:hypothetical protein